MGYRTLFSDDLEAQQKETNLKQEGLASTRVLQNQFFHLTADLRTGRVTSLVDNRAGRELIRQDSAASSTNNSVLISAINICTIML
jgi:hypothetical protein